MPDETLRVPVWCPICSSLMKGKSTQSYYDFGCCISCKIQWIEGRENRWKSGWRPSEKELSEFMNSLDIS
jgi:hypothetical protein